jgi:hypothetical protein
MSLSLPFAAAGGNAIPSIVERRGALLTTRSG